MLYLCPDCLQLGTLQPHCKKGKLSNTKTGFFAANQCSPHYELPCGVCGTYVVLVACIGSSRSIRLCAVVCSQLLVGKYLRHQLHRSLHAPAAEALALRAIPGKLQYIKVLCSVHFIFHVCAKLLSSFVLCMARSWWPTASCLAQDRT